MSNAAPDSSSRSIELACERLHPIHCAEVLIADSPAELVAVARVHGADVHGFTPAWYGPDRLNTMTATVMRHLEWRPRAATER